MRFSAHCRHIPQKTHSKRTAVVPPPPGCTTTAVGPRSAKAVCAVPTGSPGCVRLVCPRRCGGRVPSTQANTEARQHKTDRRESFGATDERLRCTTVVQHTRLPAAKERWTALPLLSNVCFVLNRVVPRSVNNKLRLWGSKPMPPAERFYCSTFFGRSPTAAEGDASSDERTELS